MLQLSNVAQKRYFFIFTPDFSAIYLLCFQGLMFLVYPLLGHLAEVYLARYQAMKCGLVSIIYRPHYWVLWLIADLKPRPRVCYQS